MLSFRLLTSTLYSCYFQKWQIKISNAFLIPVFFFLSREIIKKDSKCMHIECLKCLIKKMKVSAKMAKQYKVINSITLPEYNLFTTPVQHFLHINNIVTTLCKCAGTGFELHKGLLLCLKFCMFFNSVSGKTLILF